MTLITGSIRKRSKAVDERFASVRFALIRLDSARFGLIALKPLFESDEPWQVLLPAQSVRGRCREPVIAALPKISIQGL
jgi:hypothetical protein